jgi:hypothetical protein
MANNKNDNNDQCGKINSSVDEFILAECRFSVLSAVYLCGDELQEPVSCTFPLVCLPFRQEQQ